MLWRHGYGAWTRTKISQIQSLWSYFGRPRNKIGRPGRILAGNLPVRTGVLE